MPVRQLHYGEDAAITFDGAEQGVMGLDKTVIIVPGIPPSINRWPGNPFKRQRLKTLWEREVWVSAYQSGATKLRLERARVRITYYFATQRRRDKDNYAPKMLMDGLVKAGVLMDDSKDRVDLDWGFARGEPERTEIVIVEVRQCHTTSAKNAET
jgi:Holliday junction resolvase RusA-like endonuclease